MPWLAASPPASNREIPRRALDPARRLARAREGTAAIEFALVLPVLLLLMLAGLQLVTYVNATRKIERVSKSISQMISQSTPPNGGSVATVNATDIHFSYDSALVLFPYAMTDAQRRGISWWQDISVNYAVIQFTKTSSNCSDPTDQSGCYVANVVWTSTGTYQPVGGDNYRPCVVPQIPIDNATTPNRNALPRSVFGPASLIVIDVVFSFTPTFGARFIPAIRIARSSFVQPRYATLVNFDTTNNDGIATKCPGY